MPRRTAGRPAGGSDAIVNAVLGETLAQLGARGISALSVEEIARAVGVNKTTIYRRWPSKPDLVLAAMQLYREKAPRFVPTGRLRDDLIALLEAKAAALSTPRGRKLANALAAVDDGEAAAVAAAVRGLRFALPASVIQQAIDRGEIASDTDPLFVSELLHGPIVNRVLMLNEPVDRGFITKVVDHVLAGLAPGAAARPARTRRSR